MGRQSKRDRVRALDEQQAGRDPARRHGGRGLQVRHHRGDARDRFPGEKEVIASGGGLIHSPTWTRIMADTLGRPVTLSGVKEASSRGAALIALEALGGPEIEAADVPLGETFEPDPARHEDLHESARTPTPALRRRAWRRVEPPASQHAPCRALVSTSPARRLVSISACCLCPGLHTEAAQGPIV